MRKRGYFGGIWAWNQPMVRRSRSRLMAGEEELAGVEAGLGLGDAAVVDLDLGGRAGEDDAGGGGGAAGDAQALGLGCGGWSGR